MRTIPNNYRPTTNVSILDPRDNLLRNVIYLIFRLFSINFQIHQTSHLNWAILSTVVIFIQRSGIRWRPPLLTEIIRSRRIEVAESASHGRQLNNFRSGTEIFDLLMPDYSHFLNLQKFAFDHREPVSFSRTINTILVLFFHALARIIFTTEHTFTRQHTVTGAPLLLRDRVPFVASIPTYFSFYDYAFESGPFCTFNYFCGSFQNWKSAFGNLCWWDCCHASLAIIWSKGTNFGGKWGVFESNGINSILRRSLIMVEFYLWEWKFHWHWTSSTLLLKTW